MTMDVTGAWASNALWPDSSTTRKSNTDYDALARRAATDDAKSSTPAGLDTAVKKATPSGFTQDDFALATRLGPNGMAPQSLQALTGLQRIDREPWHGVDRAASNPYGNILGSLRRAALRRDAAAPAVPAPDTTLPAAAESNASATSLTVSTAIAAYTAAAAQSPATSGAGASSGGSTSAGGTTSSGGTASSGGTTSAGGTTSSGGTASSGGTTSSGGAESTGGTTSSGGAESTGGTESTGGATSAGGTTATGGTTSAGGTTATGGTTSTGGTTETGGTPSSGGTGSTGRPAWWDLLFGHH